MKRRRERKEGRWEERQLAADNTKSTMTQKGILIRTHSLRHLARETRVEKLQI